MHLGIDFQLLLMRFVSFGVGRGKFEILKRKLSKSCKGGAKCTYLCRNTTHTQLNSRSLFIFSPFWMRLLNDDLDKSSS